MADGSIKIDVDVGIQQAEKQLEDLKKKAQDSGDSVSESMDIDIDNLDKQFQKAGNSIEKTRSKVQALEQQLSEIQNAKVELQFEESVVSSAIQGQIQLNEQLRSGAISQSEFNQLIKEKAQDYDNAVASSERLAESIRSMGNEDRLSTQLQNQKGILDNQVISYEMLGNRAEKMTNRIDDASVKASKLNDETKKVDSSMKSASKSSGDMGKNLGMGVKRLTKYALALFSIRTVYQTLRRLSNQWLNSDNAAAKQVNANISAMSQALSNALGPVIQWLANLMAYVFGYVNAILKAFFGIDLLAKNTAKNTGGVASNTKKARKEAEKFSSAFDKADIASSKVADNMDGAGGGGGMDMPAPKLPELDVPKWVKKILKDLQPFIDTIKSIDFTPMQENFARVVKSMEGLLNVLYNSFIRTMNNAVAPFIKIMSEVIIPKALLSISEAIDTITPHIEWFMTSFVEPFIEFMLTEFTPVFLFMLIEGFDLLIAILDPFIEGFLIALETIRPFAEFIGNVLLIVMGTLAVAFQWLTEEIGKEDSALANLIKVIGFLVGIFTVVNGTMLIVGGVIAALTKVGLILTNMFGGVLAVIKVVAGFFAGAFTGAILPIIVLVALLGTMLIGLIDNFEQVKQDFMRIVGNIKGIFTGLIDFIAGIFTGDWGRAWEGVKSIFKNIIDGIANIFKFPINLIIDGINVFLRGLNKVKIPKWVPVVGGKGFNISPIPRLAQGTYVTGGAMTAIVGEAGKEAVVPLENNTEWIHDFLNLANANGGLGGGGTNVTNIILDGSVLATATSKEESKRNVLLNGVVG